MGLQPGWVARHSEPSSICTTTGYIWDLHAELALKLQMLREISRELSGIPVLLKASLPCYETLQDLFWTYRGIPGRINATVLHALAACKFSQERKKSTAWNGMIHAGKIPAGSNYTSTASSKTKSLAYPRSKRKQN